MANAPFVHDVTRSARSIAYRNRDLIADAALPRVPVGSRQYTYTVWNKGDHFTIPDTQVGRKGEVNTVEFGAGDAPGLVKTYGLGDDVPNVDIEEGRKVNIDPLNTGTAGLTDLILLSREKRVADLVQNPSSYGSNTQVLSGTDVWTHADAKPLQMLSDLLEDMFQRANTLTLSGKAALALRKNASVVRAFNGSLGEDGLVPMSFIQQVLEVDRILVGRSKLNGAHKGQEVSFQNVWGDHCSLTYISPQQTVRGELTFGWTAQYGNRIVNRMNKKIGLHGGVRIEVGEEVEEKVVASDAGYLLRNVI